MTRMFYLDAVEAGCDERLESFANSAVSRVRPDGQCSCFVRDLDRIFQREPSFGNESAASVAEICHECVAKIVDYAACDQCARDVRASDRAAIRLSQHFLQRKRNTQRVEL